MKERPILFSAPMVRAILEGRKTQTRRIVKPSTGKQSEWLTEKLLNSVPHGKIINGGWQMHHPLSGTVLQGVNIEKESPLGWIKSPLGKARDQLWVRETFAENPDIDSESIGHVFYRADYHDGKCPISSLRWRPSIFMLREYSRIQLEITGISVERLNDISEEDAIAEGVGEHWICSDSMPDNPHLNHNPLSRFIGLWKSINGPNSWNQNPWVWVIEFKRIQR